MPFDTIHWRKKRSLFAYPQSAVISFCLLSSAIVQHVHLRNEAFSQTPGKEFKAAVEGAPARHVRSFFFATRSRSNTRLVGLRTVGSRPTSCPPVNHGWKPPGGTGKDSHFSKERSLHQVCAPDSRTTARILSPDVARPRTSHAFPHFFPRSSEVDIEALDFTAGGIAPGDFEGSKGDLE